MTSLRCVLDAQRAAFARGAPDYRRRMDALATLRDAVWSRRDELARAVSADFGGRSPVETLMLELLPFFDEIQHARRHLKEWMQPRRAGSTWFLLPSRAYVLHQPLGVAGVIGAWNYQLLLTLGPLVDALAAGNHVIVKPSEITPRAADVIAQLIGREFDPEYVACVTGGPEVAQELSSLPLDHLFFTGSTRVGHLVMQAAAAHLTPVTLELGGKSPAIVHRDYPLRMAVERIIAGKLMNAGQTCVAPDYVLIPARHRPAFEQLSTAAVAHYYPRLVGNEDYTRIVSVAHYERLTSYVSDARARGASVVTINPADEACSVENRVFPPTLILEPSDEMQVMRDEIFGPILPVVTYDSLDDAIAFVNARPRPLALYYFDTDRRRIDDLLRRTLSGGVTINDCIFHLGQHNLPFGGVGRSGMGHYHGFDGFATFSKKRAVMIQRRVATTVLFRPPYGARMRAMLDRVLALARR
jgi:coniferyl-aldehyde dehydrogenase